MRLFVIRHKETRKLMPEYKSGKGYSFWLYDNVIDNQRPTPRILESRAKAEKVIIEWAKGIFVWRPQNLQDDPYYLDQRRVMKDLGRSKDELEVVPVELLEIKELQ